MKRRSLRKNRKQQPWTLAKENRMYGRREVVAMYNNTDNTITNWIKDGLPVAQDGDKQIFRGADLNAFHRDRAARRRHVCDGADLYCVRCKKPHPPAGMACQSRSEAGATYNVISWTCSGCLQVASCFGYSRLLKRLAAAGVALNASEHDGDS